MTGRRPPRIAQALLEQALPADHALVGDLLEEYQHGRSRWWYWRQAVTIATRSAAGGEARLAGGLLIGAGVHYAFGYPTGEFINLLNLWWTPRVPGWFLDYDLHQLWAIAFMFLVFHLLGIIVTGLHDPRRRMAALVAFIAYVFLFDFGYGSSGYHDWSGLARYVGWAVPTFAAQCAGLLIGGTFFWPPPQRRVA